MVERPKFTRMHYEMIAATLAGERTIMPTAVFEELVDAFADMFHEDNYRFDTDRFVTACYRRAQ